MLRIQPVHHHVHTQPTLVRLAECQHKEHLWREIVLDIFLQICAQAFYSPHRAVEEGIWLSWREGRVRKPTHTLFGDV
eukprot:2840753-Rhodomonas_salina.1